MKFSVGDKVLVKHTKEEGKVIRLLNDNMVEIEVLNTHFPAFVDELDHPYLEWFTNKKLNAKKRSLSLDDFPTEQKGFEKGSPATHSGLEQGFYCAILPVYFFDAQDETLSRLKIYFINQTEHSIKLKYDCLSNMGKEFTLATTIYPFQHIYLHHIRFDLVNDKLSFDFQIESIGKQEDVKSLNHQIKLKPKTLFQKLHELQNSGLPMFSINIAKDFPVLDLSRLNAENLFATPSKPSNAFHFKKKSNFAQELDLHIEQLVDNHHQLSSHQKLEAQLQACEQGILNAWQHQKPSIIIIHGIGGGRLREEVHLLLKAMKKQVRHFENKYSQKYGFGATEVFLRY